MAQRLELPKFQAFDSNGDPLSGGKVYTYAAGTTTAKATTDDDGATNANPVILDSRGEADIYLNGSYKIVLKDSSDTTIWTVDNVEGGFSDNIMSGYYFPSSDASDHSVTGDSDTIKYAIDTISTDEATIYLKHDSGSATTTYTCDGNISGPENITLEVEPGAILDIQTGDTFTWAGPIKGEGQIFSMATADSVSYTGPSPLHSKWFGATHDGSTDDSTALNNLIGACTSAGNKIIIDDGTTRCNSVDFDVDNLIIEQIGTFKPYSDSGYCIQLGESANISAFNIDVDTGSDYETWTTVTGCQISDLYTSEIHFKRVEGCKIGILLTNTTATGCTYNKFFLGRIIDSEINIKIDPANSGWVNQNRFYGGRFTHFSGKSSYASAYHVWIAYDSTYNPNANYFYSPSFEGYSQGVFYCDGASNGIIDARVELSGSTTFDQLSIWFGSNSAKNIFTTSYTDNLIDGGIGITAGNIVTTSGDVLTITGDYTGSLFKGQLIEVTMDDASQHIVAVAVSSYSNPDTTVRLAWEIPGYVSTTNEVDTLKYMPIFDQGRGNTVSIERADYASVANLSYVKNHETFSYHHGGMTLKGLSNKIPALSILPDNSAGDDVFVIRNFTGTTLTIDGNGNLTLFNSSNGQKRFYFDQSNIRLSLYDASESEALRLDGTDGSVSVITTSDGSGVANNSLFRRAADNLLCWKNNSGTIQVVDVT